MHALIYINPSFHFGSGCLYPLKNCSKCSYTRYYVVFHGSLDWGLIVCILIISIKLDLKCVKTTKTRRIVTCYRDVADHIIAVSRRLHSSNQYAFMLKKLFVLKAQQSFLTMQLLIRCYHDVPVVFCIKPAGHGPTDFLNCVKTTVSFMSLAL